MSSGSFKNVTYKMSLEIIYLLYLYKKDLVLYNLQWLICHKAKPNQTKPNQTHEQWFKFTKFGSLSLILQYRSHEYARLLC